MESRIARMGLTRQSLNVTSLAPPKTGALKAVFFFLTTRRRLAFAGCQLSIDCIENYS